MSFHLLIKRRGQRGLRKRLPLLQTEQQSQRWLMDDWFGYVMPGETGDIKDYHEEKSRSVPQEERDNQVVSDDLQRFVSRLSGSQHSTA